MKAYAISDIHGNYKGLIELLGKVNFDYNLDKLYFLGDLADGYDDVLNCLLLFKRIKNLHPIFGNHDLYIKDWIFNNKISGRWLNIGGNKTIKLLESNKDLVKCYLNKCTYHKLYKDIFLCHGGFDYNKAINNQKLAIFTKNRQLYRTAMQYENIGKQFDVTFNDKKISKIIIGHNSTKNHLPHFVSNVVNIDTGCLNVNGKLTLLDLDSFEYYQSKKSKFYY